MKVLPAVVLSVSIFCAAAYAGGGTAGGAREITQQLNHAELVTQIGQMAEQLNQQIRMVQDMAQNTMSLPNQLLGDVMGVVAAAMNAYNQTQGILARLSHIDEEFYRSFYTAQNSAAWAKNYSDAYFALSKKLDEEAEKRVESLKISAGDITDSGKMLERLAENAESADGRNAIIQASNEFLGFMGGELVKVRTLLTEQTKSYLDYAERRRTLEDAAAETMKRDIENWQYKETQVEIPWSW
jgi:P-type conjugative transfer protein TrbJ